MTKLLLLSVLVIITMAIAIEGFREFELEEELALAKDARSSEETALDRQERSPKKGKQNRNKKNNKGRKSKGKKSNSKKNGRKGLRQTCPITETCLSNAMTYLKMMKDNVGNYLKQDKRMKSANKTVDNKSGKKGIFGPTLRRIVKAGGGNKSNLQCSGSSTSKGALQLKNLTDTLLKCEKTINASCDKESFPHPNMTAVKECKTAMDSFKTLVDGCQKKSGSEACTCWTDTAFTPLVATIKSVHLLLSYIYFCFVFFLPCNIAYSIILSINKAFLLHCSNSLPVSSIFFFSSFYYLFLFQNLLDLRGLQGRCEAAGILQG